MFSSGAGQIVKATFEAQSIAKSSLVADHGIHIDAIVPSSKLLAADLPTIGNDAAALIPLPSFRTLTAQSASWCCVSVCSDAVCPTPLTRITFEFAGAVHLSATSSPSKAAPSSLGSESKSIANPAADFIKSAALAILSESMITISQSLGFSLTRQGWNKSS